MGGEDGGYAVWVGVGEKVQAREEGPEAAPAAGEDAGPSGDGGVAEPEKDVNENVVG